MKHLTSYFLILIAAISLCACSSDNSEGGDDGPTTYRRSVIIYVAAQNSLGAAGAARLDSAEVYNGAILNSNSKDNVFLFIDDARLPRLYRIYKYKNRTICDKIKVWPEDVCSSDPATLCDIIKSVGQQYPSESYGLVLWSHGSGWLASDNVVNTLKSRPFSFGIDVGPGGDMRNDKDADNLPAPKMDIADMAQAIRQSGVTFDYIFFDACLMQNIEVAYELKDVTRYLVGSPISTSAYGGYYTNLIPRALMAYPANDQNVSLIASQYYYDAVENPDLRKYYGETGCVISVIKTEQLPQLAQATGQLIAKYLAGKKSPSLINVQTYCSSQAYNSPDFCDMGSVMGQMVTSEEYAAWTALAKQVVINYKASNKFILSNTAFSTRYGYITDRDHILGVSMYVPRNMFNSPQYSQFNQQFKKTAWYRDANWAATGW